MISEFISKYVFIGCVFLSITSCNIIHSELAKTQPADAQEAMSSWEDHKFSMFIHWGLYAIPAGVWDGKEITGYSEQFFNLIQIVLMM